MWISKHLLALLFCFGFLVFMSVAASADKMPKSHQLREAVQCIRERQSRLRRLFVDSYSTSVVRGTSRTDRIIFAFAGDSAFLEFIHDTNAGKEMWLDPGRFCLYVNNTESTLFKPFERFVAPDNIDSSRHFWNHQYLQAIDWKPTNEYLSGTVVNDYLTSMLSGDFVLVDSSSVGQDVSLMHIANQFRSEELWLAPELEYAVVKRVIVREGPIRTKRTFTMSDFVEVAADIWLPRAVSVSVLQSTSDGLMEQAIQSDIGVTQLAVNDQVPLDMFGAKILPGTLSSRPEEEPVLISSGGQDLMDVWGAWCATVLPIGKPRRVLGWLVYLTLMNSFLLTVGILRILVARRTRSDNLAG